MFSLKQMFIVLLSFTESLIRDGTKCLLNDKPFMVKSTLVDLNPVELNYYPFIFLHFDKCNGSYNVLTPTICVPKESKDISVKEFNMIANKHEAKTLIKHISYDYKCRFNSATCN